MGALSTIPQHFVTEFDTNWQHLLQQKIDKTREYVMVDHVRGKEKSFNQISTAEMQPVTVRAGVTRITDIPTAKRWLRPYPYDLATLFDEWDEEFLGTIVLPKSSVVDAHVYAYSRAVDRVVINAALGTNYTGETGVTPVTLPVGQQIGVGFVETGSAANSGLTIGKLRQAKYILDNNEVDDQETRVLFVCAKQLQDLLQKTEVTSSDYNTVKALVEGTVNSFMGFQFKRISNQILPIDTTLDIRTCVGWAKSGMVLTDTGRETKMDIRADLSHSLQIRTIAALGATRTEEGKVVSIACDESP